MDFGKYYSKQVFEIEKSKIYKSLQEGLKIGEFVVYKNETLFVIEAKKSAPNPGGEIGFSKFIEDVSEKLINTLHLTVSLAINRHQDSTEEVCSQIRESTIAGCRIVLCLVIKGHKKEWLMTVQNGLRTILKKDIKIWGLDIFAINEDKARDMELVV